MRNHPCVQIPQRARVTAGGIVGAVLELRVLLAPIDPQPQRQSDPVCRLLRAEHVDILVLSDESLQSTIWRHVVSTELLFDRRPRTHAALSLQYQWCTRFQPGPGSMTGTSRYSSPVPTNGPQVLAPPRHQVVRPELHQLDHSRAKFRYPSV